MRQPLFGESHLGSPRVATHRYSRLLRGIRRNVRTGVTEVGRGPNLQRALDAAKPRDTLRVKAGLLNRLRQRRRLLSLRGCGGVLGLRDDESDEEDRHMRRCLVLIAMVVATVSICQPGAASTLRVRLDANDTSSNLDIHKVVTN